MPANSSRPPRNATLATGLTALMMPGALAAAGLAMVLVAGAPGAAGSAYAGRIMSVPRPGGPVKLAGAGWAGQIGATLLAPVIKAAGGDKAPKADPDAGPPGSGDVLTGAGVGVALIDSGVSPVPGLNGPGKVMNGPDLSFESQSPATRYLDTYGHGTHMAGIIAGQDPATVPAAARFNGVAPGAHIVSLKVASANGASDVSQVVAAIDWVVEHRNDKGLNIRVLNLSFGTESTQSAALDPLSFAVQQAWDKGIVVVVAAGNDGLAKTTLTMPAANADVIAVGAADSKGTEVRTDDTVADFTNRGNAARHPDVLASGRSVVSLRDPGSYIDRTYPTAKLSTTADPAQRFFRGSGTSQAAAMVSGAAALLLQQRPNLKPDQVKQLLMATANPLSGAADLAAGRGQINIAAAALTKTPTFKQLNLPPTGLGSLQASRGGAYVYDPATGTSLTGEKDIFGKAWNAPGWSLASRTQNSWKDGTFNGSVWTGGALGAQQYGEQTWSATVWTGRSWSGADWAGRSWSGADWTGRSWSAAGWTGEPWH